MPVDLHAEEARRLQRKIDEMEKGLRALTTSDLCELATSTNPEEQLPALMSLAFIGDDDTSWENAQECLRSGSLLEMVLEMDGEKYVTKRTISCIAKLGQVEPESLRNRRSAAHALALFIEACLVAAGHRLELRVPTAVTVPKPSELPPAWPIKIEFKDIMKQVDEAARWNKTALLVCNGHAEEADTFFSYRGMVQIDAKWMMGEVDIKKVSTLSEMQKVLKRQLLDAMKCGLPIQIAMSGSAVDFKSKYCKTDYFPDTIFNTKLFRKPTEYTKLLSEHDKKTWGKDLLKRMKTDVYSFVTTDFDLRSAMEFLPEALPYLDHMAIIEIDIMSFKAEQVAAEERRSERQNAMFRRGTV
eukprot:gnl/MRDRNA2_/MRDRNA2_98946_c0_seq1.p1 gnl/MRDRNA2_/MRDRNA2_98946_c0~~gnl/MRDRNA2_/MRDRNA2_98946_c0_seq1.p1  ORF type:complete len:357 (-),score=83.04 gnl/MRDRNA2_/MRDRNA2_98946_c0_seq1:44-1114(-)